VKETRISGFVRPFESPVDVMVGRRYLLRAVEHSFDYEWSEPLYMIVVAHVGGGRLVFDGRVVLQYGDPVEDEPPCLQIGDADLVEDFLRPYMGQSVQLHFCESDPPGESEDSWGTEADLVIMGMASV
jgi:hypothetical protein